MRACRGPTRDRPRNGGRRPGEGSAGRLVDHPRSPEPGSAPRVRRGGPVWPEGQRRPDVDRMRAARSRMAAASNLIPLPEVLEQDWAELDEPKGGLAPGDDGVHAGAVAVVRADAAVAIAVEGGGVTTGAAISLAGDQIDERCFLGLLHGSLSLVGQGRSAGGRRWGFGQAGSWPILRPRGFAESIGTRTARAKRKNFRIIPEYRPVGSRPCKRQRWGRLPEPSASVAGQVSGRRLTGKEIETQCGQLVDGRVEAPRWVRLDHARRCG